MSIRSLSLRNYRNFSEFDIIPEKENALIIGSNGVGKTNILEAISLFSPGSGLRNANHAELSFELGNFWQIESVMQSYAPFNVSLSWNNGNNRNKGSKKDICINGRKSQISELRNILQIIWITPQMMNLLIGPSQNRRKFLDRIVYSYDITHATNCNKYIHYAGERLKLLQFGSRDEQWLNVIEENLAKVGAKIFIARQNVVKNIQKALYKIKDLGFTEILVGIDTGISFDDNFFSTSEKYFGNLCKLALSEDNAIEYNIKRLYDNRRIDSQRKQTTFGPHKSDLKTVYVPKSISGDLCSTGEQKIIVTTLILAQAFDLNQKCGLVLLLDELFTHLDENYRILVTSLLSNLKAQKWITTTELSHTEILGSNYGLLKLEQK